MLEAVAAQRCERAGDTAARSLSAHASCVDPPPHINGRAAFFACVIRDRTAALAYYARDSQTMLQISQSVEHGILTLALGGQLNAEGAMMLGNIVTAWQSQGGRSTIIDLHHITYVGSAGLKVLMHHASAAKAAGGHLVLAAVNDPIFQVFDVGGCARALTFAPDRDEALRMIAGQQTVVSAGC
ncbi:STAS domain-containing protein [Chelatococcus reniformis]|uniref:Anti-sigma factor antagonist n=1 Tax=Chelatococcus reniformis TaxID=1494448 RepID=A0A916X732_9HYPH|nr:STAS domain-containing protein [Chelatococcus reniformis]GGC48643.1 hypothetical protein GCM10010994_04790 [Chelatococcus reniformis]